MSYFEPQRFNILPPVVKNILIINGLMFLATISLYSSGISLTKYLGMYYFIKKF